MADVHVDVEIRSDKAKKGSKEAVDGLNKIDKANEKVQKGTKRTADEFSKSGQRIAASTGKVDKRLKKTGDTAKKTNKEVMGLTGGVKGLAASFTAFPIGPAAIIVRRLAPR